MYGSKHIGSVAWRPWPNFMKLLSRKDSLTNFTAGQNFLGAILTQYTAHETVAGNLYLPRNNNVCSANLCAYSSFMKLAPDLVDMRTGNSLTVDLYNISLVAMLRISHWMQTLPKVCTAQQIPYLAGIDLFPGEGDDGSTGGYCTWGGYHTIIM